MGKLGLLGFRLFFLDRLLVSRWENSASSWINRILSSLRNRRREESESEGERSKKGQSAFRVSVNMLVTLVSKLALEKLEWVLEWAKTSIPREHFLTPSCLYVFVVWGLFPLMEICFLFLAVLVSPAHSLFYSWSSVSTHKKHVTNKWVILHAVYRSLFTSHIPETFYLCNTRTLYASVLRHEQEMASLTKLLKQVKMRQR